MPIAQLLQISSSGQNDNYYISTDLRLLIQILILMHKYCGKVWIGDIIQKLNFRESITYGESMNYASINTH